MKLRNKFSITALASILIGSSFALLPAKAIQTGEQQLDQNQVVAVAVPGGRFYNLVVVEQVAGKKSCWQESGSQPTVIDPLWTTFDFTGICGRAADSNGYSIRLDGQDTSQDYGIDLVERNGEIQLVAVSRADRSRTVVGKTFGKVDGQFLKIFLNPGWKFSKKTFDGKTLGHFFFSGDTAAIAAAGDNPPAPPAVATAASFTDTNSDTYKEEIDKAVGLGFIAGFKDNTFKPQEPLTREQLVSMVIGAVGTIPNIPAEAPATASQNPYPDVVASRWSATKIQWAKDNQIVKGYPDGSFQPQRPVTRAELMAVLESTAKFVSKQQNKSLTSQNAQAFADISGHWGEDLITKLSGYCKVASPFNEVGNKFLPNDPSGRNYAAAATLRMHGCLTESDQ